jgi:predicted oxidoreductase
MYNIELGKSGLLVPTVAVGCMRISDKSEKEVSAFVDTALSHGANFFDHADIYGGGKSELLFGDFLKRSRIKREDIYIQTKCAIHDGQYDFSKEHILRAVEGSLSRLGVEYVDFLLLHRPDTLMQPEEVAEAFDILETSGKVRAFGVSNHNAMDIELLKTEVKQPLVANQLQFSLTEAGMVTSGMNVNMKNSDSVMHDGGLLAYSRIKKMTVQAWSPFQHGFFKGTYIDNDAFPELNSKLAEIAKKYGISKTGVATAWILRHPANMQLITGTMNPDRLEDICRAADATLSRAEWYEIYRAAGHSLP